MLFITTCGEPLNRYEGSSLRGVNPISSWIGVAPPSSWTGVAPPSSWTGVPPPSIISSMTGVPRPFSSSTGVLPPLPINYNIFQLRQSVNILPVLLTLQVLFTI